MMKVLLRTVMNLFQISQIGSFHTNHNEDHLISCPIGTQQHLLALMDGCSMGTDSHFASCLISKILKKIASEFYYREFIRRETLPLQILERLVLSKLFKELISIKNQLGLEIEEMLATLVLGILDPHQQEAVVIVIGDGVICCNKELIFFDQNDKPDYLAYHLSEDFDRWYQTQSQKRYFHAINDLSIATDGVFTFRPYANIPGSLKTEEELIDYLLIDKSERNNPNILKKKLIHIEEEWGLVPSDDLSIIRWLSSE